MLLDSRASYIDNRSIIVIDNDDGSIIGFKSNGFLCSRSTDRNRRALVEHSSIIRRALLSVHHSIKARETRANAQLSVDKRKIKFFVSFLNGNQLVAENCSALVCVPTQDFVCESIAHGRSPNIADVGLQPYLVKFCRE